LHEVARSIAAHFGGSARGGVRDISPDLRGGRAKIALRLLGGSGRRVQTAEGADLVLDVLLHFLGSRGVARGGEGAQVAQTTAERADRAEYGLRTEV
jgi:hypothetical protein